MKKIIQIKNAKILPFGKNFGGNGFPWKSFLVEISKEDTKIWESKGVTVKVRKSENPDFNTTYYVKVKFKFEERNDGSFYPKIYSIPNNMGFKKAIDPTTASELNFQDIISADLDVSLYKCTTNSGVIGTSLLLHEGTFYHRP